MFSLHDTVQAKKDFPEYKIKKGFLGAIVDVLNHGEAYIVEFIDENGYSIEDALFTEFTKNDLVLVQKQ